MLRNRVAGTSGWKRRCFGMGLQVLWVGRGWGLTSDVVTL